MTATFSNAVLDTMIATRFTAIEKFAETCYPIEGAKDVIMVADYAIGSRLPDG